MAIPQQGVDFLERSIQVGRPVPGQSLTNSKDQPYNWERPPAITEPKEAMYAVFNNLIEPETITNVLISISKGMGVVDIASILLYTGFIEGQWNPDLMIILMEPTMYMIMALSEKAEIEYVIETGDAFLQDTSAEEDNVQKMKKELITLEDIKKEATSKISSHSIPKEIKEQVENIKIAPSLLEKLEIEKTNNSLLSKGER
tara:strand:+ start:850 stop:1452 length:603 start_codon:yes stop_codon:yes gene_type:complete